MRVVGTSLALMLAVAALAAAGRPAAAQAPPVAGLDASAGWTLDTGHPRSVPGKPARRKGVATKPVSPQEAERAARLAEARRKFFATEPDRRGPEPVHEFGGYDPATMGDGSMRPTAGFKF